MRIMTMAASLRKDSFNKKLIVVTSKILENIQVEVDHAQFNEFDVPLYNGDIDLGEKKPDGVMAFAQRFKAADAMVLSSPEYNNSMPGTIKNLIDWMSRIKPVPFVKKPIFLLSASPSLVGGNRGLWALRVPFEVCGAFVYPDMFSLAKAHEAFTKEGDLVDNQNRERLEKTLKSFVDHLKKLL